MTLTPLHQRKESSSWAAVVLGTVASGSGVPKLARLPRAASGSIDAPTIVAGPVPLNTPAPVTKPSFVAFMPPSVSKSSRKPIKIDFDERVMKWMLMFFL